MLHGERGHMAVDTSPKPDGLKVALDTIVAPKEAFEAIRSAPTWGLAFLIVLILFGLGGYLLTPANMHAMAADWPNVVAQSPALSGMSADQQQQQLQLAEKVSAFAWIIVVIAVPIYIVIATVLYLIFDKIGRGDGSFGKYWAAATNISIVAGLGYALTAVIAMIRGADSFNKPMDVITTMPSLLLLAPHAAPKVAALLGSVTPFSIWAIVLGAIALRTIGRVQQIPAWLGAIAVFLVPALFGAAFAR
jgi:hypothetical protein